MCYKSPNFLPWAPSWQGRLIHGVGRRTQLGCQWHGLRWRRQRTHLGCENTILRSLMLDFYKPSLRARIPGSGRFRSITGLIYAPSTWCHITMFHIWYYQTTLAVVILMNILEWVNWYHHGKHEDPDFHDILQLDLCFLCNHVKWYRNHKWCNWTRKE